MRFVDGKAHLSRDRCVPIMSLIYFLGPRSYFSSSGKCHAADSEHNGQFADVATGLFPACNKGILIMLPGFFNAVFPRQLDMLASMTLPAVWKKACSMTPWSCLILPGQWQLLRSSMASWESVFVACCDGPPFP